MLRLTFSVLFVAVVFAVVINAEPNYDVMDEDTRDIYDSLNRRESRQWVQQVPGQILVPANGQQVLVPAQAQQNVVTIQDPRCFWAGTSPFCFPDCGKKFKAVRKDAKGDGKKCVTGMKSLCCPKD